MRLLQGHVVAGLFIVGNIHSTSFDTLGFLFAMTVQFLSAKNWTRWSNFFPGQLLRDRSLHYFTFFEMFFTLLCTNGLVISELKNQNSKNCSHTPTFCTNGLVISELKNQNSKNCSHTPTFC